MLGLKANRSVNFMMQNHLGKQAEEEDSVATFHRNLDQYLSLCEKEGYGYDFMITAVSGVFSDNAPRRWKFFAYHRGVQPALWSGCPGENGFLQELYAAIRPKLEDAPVYRGT